MCRVLIVMVVDVSCVNHLGIRRLRRPLSCSIVQIYLIGLFQILSGERHRLCVRASHAIFRTYHERTPFSGFDHIGFEYAGFEYVGRGSKLPRFAIRTRTLLRQRQRGDQGT